MQIADAQHEVRHVFLGGFVGQLVSSLLWTASAALATWSTPRLAITVLVIGGFFIFPATQAGLRLIGRPGRLSRDNPFGELGMQVAFTLPLTLPIVGAAALYRLDWFYPAFMITLGAHYLPFVFLYGMRMFYGLAAVLVGAGFVIGRFGAGPWHAGAWLTAAVLLVFAVIGRAQVVAAERRGREAPLPASLAAEGEARGA
jgi:hypothetical protein